MSRNPKNRKVSWYNDQQMGILLVLCILALPLNGQVNVEGYAFESDNRGYLNQVHISIMAKGSDQPLETAYTNREGFFSMSLPERAAYTLVAEKPLFHPTRQDLVVETAESSQFVKVELNRKPGYLLDVTLAEKRTAELTEANAIKGARIEIFNNTTNELLLALEDYPHPNFNFTFQQGNHYTLMVRKKGYYTKRLEAMVNVQDCILCFDGLSSIQNITDNLTEGLEMGTLLANVEMEPVEEGSAFDIGALQYESGSAEVSSLAEEKLNELAQVLRDNPGLIVELGSHTDSQGDEDDNLQLSNQRAQIAVAHLILKGVDDSRISARGYGEGKLLNDCTDNIPCSAAQHAENRRTEITVLGFETQSREMSLLEIKEKEHYAKLLAEVQNQEQVQVKVKVEESDTLSEKDLGMVSAQPLQETVSNFSVVGDRKADQIETDIKRAHLSSNKMTTSLNAVPEGYSGFMIEVASSNVKLGAGHPKISQFDKVFYEKDDNQEYRYLFGDFGSVGDALLFLEEQLLDDYPKAKIIEFSLGKRR